MLLFILCYLLCGIVMWNCCDLQLRVSEEKGIKAHSGSFHMKNNLINLPVNYCSYLRFPIQSDCHVPVWVSLCPYKQTLWAWCRL